MKQNTPSHKLRLRVGIVLLEGILSNNITWLKTITRANIKQGDKNTRYRMNQLETATSVAQQMLRLLTKSQF